MTATSIPDVSGRPEHMLVMVEDVTTVREAQDRLAEALDAQRGAFATLEKLDRTKTDSSPSSARVQDRADRDPGFQRAHSGRRPRDRRGARLRRLHIQ